jgi:hypothetical protein
LPAANLGNVDAAEFQSAYSGIGNVDASEFANPGGGRRSFRRVA